MDLGKADGPASIRSHPSPPGGPVEMPGREAQWPPSRADLDPMGAQGLQEALSELARLHAQMTAFTAAWSHLLATQAPLTKVEPRPRLTPREQEVMHWTVAGKTAEEVGMILSCSARTVNFHLANVCQKLSVTNKRAAIARAVSLGLV